MGELVGTSARVPVEVLRAEVDAAGLTHVELARRLGWMRVDRKTADGGRVRRVLGLKGQDYSRGYGVRRRRAVNASTAARIREVLRDG